MKAIYRAHSQSASKYQSFRTTKGIEPIDAYLSYKNAFWVMVHYENLVTETINEVIHVSDEMGKKIGKQGDEVFSFTDYVYCIEEMSELNKETLQAFAKHGIYTGLVWLNELNRSEDYETLLILMDKELREAKISELASCKEQEFIDSYIKAHKAKFNETFPPAQY